MPTWYESQIIKDLMPILGARAVRGLETNFFLSRIYTGKSALLKVTRYLEAVLEKEERRALIITDSFTERFVKYIDDYLQLINMEYKIWSGVLPEVPISTIDEGAKVCEGFKPKIIIAIGGGSVMDTAKMILVRYERPDQNLFMILPSIGAALGLRKKIKYLIAIPTTTGTGSEVATAALITDNSRDPPKKIEVVHEELLADITILDSDFVKDLPPFLTKATGLDALAHAIGSFTTNWGNPYFDAMNKACIEEIVKYLPRSYKYGGKDLEARSHMQAASTLAAFGSYGNQAPGINHALGHSFGKIFNIHHGIAVSLFLPYGIAFKAKVTDKWMQLCPIFGIETENKKRESLLIELIQSIKNFIHSVDGPTCVKNIIGPKIEKKNYFKNIDNLANYAMNDAVTLTTYRPINEELYKKIFEYAWDGSFIDF
ncbi:MAG: iron-containing alcohol dehydrogenase [Promethearchaeota archaeon]|nr:MAG: iron-containing alcohol dehydrogenase [Candidatus Lokiarchaeota archaeon]